MSACMCCPQWARCLVAVVVVVDVRKDLSKGLQVKNWTSIFLKLDNPRDKGWHPQKGGRAKK